MVMTSNELMPRSSIQFVKYMGSKTKILPFVIKGIEEVYNGGILCDLFAGSGSLSGALGRQVPMISNDIQFYSAVLGKAYLTDYDDGSVTAQIILDRANKYFKKHYADLIEDYKYREKLTLSAFNKIEKHNRQLVGQAFPNKWHLFTKYYSGTWWSAEQCAWIDSIRKAIEDFRISPSYNTLLSSLMYAMAYNSQGTGHYAQYRDAKTISSMNDILIYRRKSIVEYFERKVRSALAELPKIPTFLPHKVLSLDYLECLKELKDATVYADPPYCFVHYSRFYHALETIVLYDYPSIQMKNGKFVKGRYREERHQSPFSIRSQVKKAFIDMFELIAANNCSLVLSYSDTGMISMEDLLACAKNTFQNHEVTIRTLDHLHMTMGRQQDRNRDVKELLILVKPK